MQLADTLPIIGGPQVSAALLRAAARRVRTSMAEAEAEAIASAYTALGELTGVGNLVPFAQSLHETGWFTSQRWIVSRNPAGIGATNDGSWGGHFETIAAGITAQYAHLLTYAATDQALSLVNRTLAQLDPRLDAMTRMHYRGVAPRWLDLSGRWAVPGPTYGQKILSIARSLA